MAETTKSTSKPLKDNLFKFWTGVHRAVFKLTNGAIAGKGMGMPVLILTTTGAKSGKQRETMLTTPLVDGDNIILIASFGGDDRHPSWYYNLKANPDVEVTMKGKKRPMRARIANEQEKPDLWSRVIAAHDNYAGYQKKTDRDIPVVILEPTDATDA